ncbi:MAG: hypothetical protein Q4G16_02425 [Cruoricaptor ignavus]|nr:hypothetical protein [Cruoricaptor ignavus]
MRLMIFVIISLFFVNTTKAQTSVSSKNSENIMFFDSNLPTDHINNRLNAVIRNFARNNGVSKENINLPYVSAHQLYIPMLYAYQTEKQDLLSSYPNLFTYKNVDAVLSSDFVTDLDKKIFIFFTAEYIRLLNSNSQETKKIYSLISKYNQDYWFKVPGKNWQTEKINFTGKKERVEAILANKYNGDKSYYNAITDNELFVMASAVSLAISEEKMQISDNHNDEIVNTFYEVMKTQVKTNDDGTWLFQPDVWRNHSDFANVKSSTNIPVAWDASHFSRFPAYLYLLKIYFSDKKEKYIYITQLQEGLAKQFIEKVAVFDKTANKYTFNNYMSGDNRAFRTNYKNNRTQGESQNYTHIFFGWWKLLPSKEISEMYDNLYNNFQIYENENEQIKRFQEIYKEIINLK